MGRARSGLLALGVSLRRLVSLLDRLGFLGNIVHLQVHLADLLGHIDGALHLVAQALHQIVVELPVGVASLRKNLAEFVLPRREFLTQLICRRHGDAPSLASSPGRQRAGIG